MRAIILFALLISALSFRAGAQANAPVNEELYQRLKHHYKDASKVIPEQPLAAFFLATSKTFLLSNDTVRRIFKEVEKLNPDVDDSTVIVRMLVPVTQQFLDSDYQRSVCPAGYEQAEPAMANYANYLCHCVPEQHEDIRRYDSSAQLVDAISACRRAIRFNDSLKTLLIGGLNNYGITAELLEPCANAYTYSHCAHLRNTITRVCCEVALTWYWIEKTYALQNLAQRLDRALRSGFSYALPRYCFDNDVAEAALGRAILWTSTELVRPYWQKVLTYTETYDYGHKLVVTYLTSEGSKINFILQATYNLRWSGGLCWIAGVHVLTSKYIDNKEHVLNEIRKMNERGAESKQR